MSQRSNSSPPSLDDPTKNVLDLVDASVLRLNDLAWADQRYYDAQINHIRELLSLRAAHNADNAVIREGHQHQLDAAESARIDSIRQVDVLATATTAAQAQTAIAALAASQAQQAETLRLAVANTATTIAAQLVATTTEINKRITSLEQSAYEGRGKQALADPQMERLNSAVEKLLQAGSATTGKTQGSMSTFALIAGIASFILTLIGIGVFVFITMRQPTTPAAAPQIIYTPSPAGTLLPSTPPATVPR